MLPVITSPRSLRLVPPFTSPAQRSSSSFIFFFFSSRRRHTRLQGDWSSDVCSSDLTRRSSVARMKVLVLNCGSSSVKYDVFDDGANTVSGTVERVVDHARALDEVLRSEERRVGKESRAWWEAAGVENKRSAQK